MSNPCGLSPALGTAFCGPTAIAAIIGASPEAVEGAVLKHRECVPRPKPRRTAQPVKSMWSSEVEPVAALLGWRAVEIPTARFTFARWLTLNRQGRDARYLVLVTGHFVAVSDGWFADTRWRVPVELSRLIRKPYARSRVQRVWRLEAGA